MKFHLRKKSNLTTEQEAIANKIIEVLGEDNGLIVEHTENQTGGGQIRIVGKCGEVSGTTQNHQDATDILRLTSSLLPYVVRSDIEGGFWSSIKIDDVVDLFELVEMSE